MGLFSKRNDDPVTVEFLQQPDSPATVEAVAEIDRLLIAVGLIRPRTAGTRARLDQLFDQRNAIREPRPLPLRPPVPVVRGRSS